MRLTIEIGAENTILRSVSKPVKVQELHTIRPLAEAMLSYIKNPKHGGIGLAAPQVGINKRVIVVGLLKDRDDENFPLILMINPVITKKSSETSAEEEGCLSLPGIRGNVERPVSVEAEWIDLKGKKIKKTITGLGAKVIQHEIDHLDGILISDKFLK